MAIFVFILSSAAYRIIVFDFLKFKCYYTKHRIRRLIQIFNLDNFFHVYLSIYPYMQRKDVVNFLDQLFARKAELTRIKSMLEKDIAGAPEGNLRISHSNKCAQYYWKKAPGNGPGKYICKKDYALAKALAQKTYEIATQNAVEKELKAIDECINRFPEVICEDIFSSLSDERKKLITPIWESDAEFVSNWEMVEYEGKEFCDELSEFYTNRDERVRSKSEVIIANALNDAGVPYRYEYPTNICGIMVYPDFTVLNVRKRREIVWEHFGMLDDNDYMIKTIRKMNLYLQGGFYMGENYICTWESSRHPLSIRHIKKIIEHYCL